MISSQARYDHFDTSSFGLPDHCSISKDKNKNSSDLAKVTKSAKIWIFKLRIQTIESGYLFVMSVRLESIGNLD